MTRLIRAELLRFRSRRVTWVALGLVLLVIGLTQIAVYTSVRPLTAAEQAQGQVAFQQAQIDYEQNRADYEKYEQECLAEGSGTAEQCSSEPKIENYVPRTVSTYAEVAELSVTVSVFVTALALLLVSAALVGGDFTSGAMGNWLSFIPERTKVFGSRLVAVVIVAAVVTAATSALAIGLTTALTAMAGSPVSGVEHTIADGGRGIALGVIATVLGFGIAMLTRHTIAAIGAVVGYLFLSFVLNIIGALSPVIDGIKRFQPENNALALLKDGYRYYVSVQQRNPDGTFSSDYVERLLPLGDSVVYWSVIVVALLAVTLLSFRRRDLN